MCIRDRALPARPAMTLELWLVLGAGAIGCAPLFPTIRRWTVAIDAGTTSLLMMLFAPVLLAWCCGASGACSAAARALSWSPLRLGRARLAFARGSASIGSHAVVRVATASLAIA